MSTRGAGFTIIEVMLVLAITGLISISLLVGWTVNINTQNYKDSANSLLAQLQYQYSELYNTSNDRTNAVNCNKGVGGAEIEVVDGVDTNTSSTNCFIMGRYLEVTSDGIKAHRIIGYENQSLSALSAMDEKQAIMTSKPIFIPEEIELPTQQTNAWKARLYSPGRPADAIHTLIAIVRSPATGSVNTYVSEQTGAGTLKSVEDVINEEPASIKEVTFCIDPKAQVASSRLAVRIAKAASSHEAVGIKTAEGGNGCV